MKFSFSLSSLLKTKEIKLREIQKNLCEAVREREKIEQQQKDLTEELTQGYRDYKELCLHGKISPEEMSIYHNYFKKLEKQLQEIAVSLDAAKKKEDTFRTLLLDISKEKKGLEKLKEKEYSRFLDDIRKKEIKEIDDISIRSFNHKNSEPVEG